jgi:hypothetical protein
LLRCSQLHEHYYELPAPIREYIQEVKAQLAMLTDWPEAGIEVEEKLSFFKETRHAYGRTALLLSGGGGLGSFHLVSCFVEGSRETPLLALAGIELPHKGRRLVPMNHCAT